MLAINSAKGPHVNGDDFSAQVCEAQGRSPHSARYHLSVREQVPGQGVRRGDSGWVIVSFPVADAAQAVNPKINPRNHNRFMCNLLDVPILGKLSYEKVTQG